MPAGEAEMKLRKPLVESCEERLTQPRVYFFYDMHAIAILTGFVV